MDAVSGSGFPGEPEPAGEAAGAPASAFAFEGDWKEFAPIAFTNLLLSIVTLGIYRFWAVTRERQYLWSRSRFIDEPLEWTGTGMELFIGFLMAILLLGLPYLVVTLISQGAVLRGQEEVAAIIALVSGLVLFYFVGVARFRALRYRLSRSQWYGIRGGSDDPGFGYGFSYIWKSIVGALAAGLMIPWAMCSLWDERWHKMSFGPHRFISNTEAGPLMKRFLLFYLLPILLAVVGAVVGGQSLAGGGSSAAFGAMIILLLVAGVAYLVLPVVWLLYYAKFYRNAVGGLSLDSLTFGFRARSADWLLLFLGDIAIVVGTLGIGSIFLGYRHWKFFVTHMEAYGEIDLDRLTQSATARASQGEGLLDALDVGAF